MYLSRDEYQYECVDKLAEIVSVKSRALVVLPTSAGKTHVFCRFIERFPNRSFLIIVPRLSLVMQTKQRLKEVIGIEASVFCSSYRQFDESRITITSAQSCHKVKSEYDFVLYDECHGQTERVESLFDPKAWIGFTATPYRNNTSIVGRFFDKIDFQIGLIDLIKSGFITRYRLTAPDEHFNTEGLSKVGGDFTQAELEGLIGDDKIKAQAVDLFKRTIAFKKIAIMAVNIDHAEKIKRNLEQFASCSIVHSKMSKEQNEHSLESFENGDNRFMVSVTKLSEGYDFPGIDCIALMRPTRSVTLMIQMIGRGLRLNEGKKYCQVIDYGDVIKNCGTPAKPILQGNKEPPNYRICRDCKTINKLSAKYCYDCFETFSVKMNGPRDYLRNLTVKPMTKVEDDIHVIKSVSVNWGYRGKSGKITPKVTLRSSERSFFVWLFGDRTNEIKTLVDYEIESDKKARLNRTYVVNSKPVKIIKKGSYCDFRLI